tara:strand:- start:1656 stop:2666 length:1011 start_codon:yes stop_codon:yes gene_type:complete
MKMHIPGMIRDTGLFAGGAVHGKGGGGAQTSTVNQSNLPAYARPYFERLMERAEKASNREYELYKGQRNAEASNDMNASYEGARNLQNTYLPSFNRASEAYTGALDQAGRAVSGYDPNVEMFNQDAAQRYMNPYIGNVIGQAQQAAQQNFLESQGGRASQAVKAGAFGGSRATIADEVARRTYDSQFQSLTADLLDKGYSNAQAQFMADRTARDNAQQFAAKLGMEGAQFGLDAGSKMQGLGESAFGLGSKQAGMLNTYGQQQQAQQQKGLDTAYEDFANQRDYERQNVNFLTGALRGVPVSPQSNSITYQPGGLGTSQALGLGIAGLGALNGAKS